MILLDADVLGRNRTGEETYLRNLLRELPQVAPDLRFAAVTRRPELVPDGVEAVELSLLTVQSSKPETTPHVRYFGWVEDYPDPQDWLSVFFAKDISNNQFNYGQNTSSTAAQQQTVQQQLAETDANPDQNARLAAYQDAEQKIP